MNVITISREFGSGGRELGKRLAEALGYAYYDREILEKLAEQTELDAGYLERVLEHGVADQTYPIHIGRTFAAIPAFANHSTSLLACQTQIIRQLAQNGNCVIVGRNANVILSEARPLRIFVYGDMKARIARCRSRAPEGEKLTDQQYEKNIRQVDKYRARIHNMLCDYDWGDVRGYDLCVNTTSIAVKDAVAPLAEYAGIWFAGREKKPE